MHPILFRIPLPKYSLPIAWLFYAAAAVAALIAVYSLIKKQKSSAMVAGVVAAIAVGARFALPIAAERWDMAAIPIYSYGVMLGLSLVVGWYLTLGLADRDGLPKEEMANNYVVTAIAAVVGSRVLYILTNLSEFDSIQSMFAMRRGGLVAYGGFLGGLLGSYLYLKKHRLPLLPWADVAVPSLASGLMITRIGCYLFGCDFGHKLSDGAPGFLKKLGTFPRWPDGTLEHGSGSPAWVQHVKANMITPAADASLPVHPTQIYESLVGLGLLVLLLLARKRQKFRGQIFLTFGFAYGVCRYLLEILRDDAERGSIPPSLPEHILIPGGLALLAIGYVIGFSKLIKNPTVQRITQVLAFVPVVALYVAMKPDAFDTNVQFSTSQFIAITSGFAASVAFGILYKAALEHPEAAMALRLPAPAMAGGPAGALDDEEDEEEDEEPAKKPVKAAAKKASKPVAKGRVSEDDVAEELAKKPKIVLDEEDEKALDAEKG